MSSQEEINFEKEVTIKLLQENCKKIGLVEIHDVAWAPAVGKFENYGSDMLRLTVSGVKPDSSSAQVSVILKQKKKKDKSLDFTDELGIFKTESMIYSHLIKAMEEIMLKINDKEEKLWPTKIACVENKIFLEDLKVLDFQLTPKEVEHSYGQAKLVVEGLGKFHALSLAAIQNGMFDPQPLPPMAFARDFPVINRFYTNGINYLIAEVEKWGPQWSDVAVKLKTAVNDIGKKFKKLWESTRGKFDVVNHGDCWSSNMMFKFSPGVESPTSMRFVDFQICHYNSPGWDLTYYLNNGLRQPSKSSMLADLLACYTASLTENCRKFGYEGPVPDYQGILEAYKEVTFFGAMVSLVHTPISIASTEKDFDFNIDDFAEEEGVSYNYYKSENVKNAMKIVLKDLVEQNCL